MKYDAGKIRPMASVFTGTDILSVHTGKRDGLYFPMRLKVKSLIHNHNNTEKEVDFTANDLENRKIRVNTHILN